MRKVLKYKVIKKYQDEIWGHLLKKKKYNYTKKIVLLNFKDFIKKLRYRVKIKYKYFKFFTFNYFSLISFKVLRNKQKFLKFIKRYFFINYFYNKNLIKFFKNNFTFQKNYLLIINNLIINNKILYKFKINKSLVNNNILNYLNSFKSLIIQKQIYFFKNINLKEYNIILKNKKNVYNNNLILNNYKYFYKMSKFQYIIKKRLNLQRQKEFFYCVHIAAPEKKKKKWSLFGLKNIYYKKLSLFFGFLKPKKFIKLYDKIKKNKKNAEYSFFLFLESRLEMFLLRINFLPSIYFIKRFIFNGNVFVNNKKIIYSDYLLKSNQIVSIKKEHFFNIYKSLKFNLKKKNIFINSPKYIEVDYKLLIAMFIKKPSYIELTRPMSFELYTSFLTISK